MEEKDIAQWIENGLPVTKVHSLSRCEISFCIVSCASSSLERISYFKTLCFLYLDCVTKLYSSCTGRQWLYVTELIKHNMSKLTVSTEFCVKAAEEVHCEPLSKDLWAEVLGCVSLTTVVRDVVDPGPCCHLISVLKHAI